MKILAVVVTHNRCALLRRCVEHLLAQARAPDGILVVNNASTDDTVAMLESLGVPCVTQENVGSAGGWHRGIAHALEQGYDAVWLMDDDGFPDVGALAALEPALGPEVACVSSIVVREDDPARFVFPFPILDPRGLPVLVRAQRKIGEVAGLEAVAPGGTYPFAHFFNGALIATSAVRAIGNVERDFFIFGDEVDYYFRLRAVGAVHSVLAARHYHPDVSQRPYTEAKVYYYLKNTMILNRRYFDAVGPRNAVAVAAVLVRTAQRNGLAEAASYVAGSRAPTFYRAIVRGLKGRVGKDLHA